MSDEEFCKALCGAAGRIGIRISKVGQGYQFVDPITMTTLAGKPDPDDKIALANACKELQNYFSGGK